MQVGVRANRSRQDRISKCLNPGRWTKTLCYDKLSKVDRLFLTCPPPISRKNTGIDDQLFALV